MILFRLMFFMSVLCMGFIGVGTLNAHAQAPVFFTDVPDVPLMAGLQELPDETVEFYRPDGRVVEFFAAFAGVDQERVRAFYFQTLPQFGWHHAGGDRYFRTQEVLELSFDRSGDDGFLKISIRPR